MQTTTQSVTGVRYIWEDNRIVDILRMDRTYTRDNRGRFASGGGGGGSSGGGKSGGGKKGGGGGGSGLTSMKASELQKIASDEGIDIDTLSHKRRKSVLAAAIEAKRKGKDLREEGLLKAQKQQSSLAKKRSRSKGKGKAKLQAEADAVKPWEDYDHSNSTKRQNAIINAPKAPSKLKPLDEAENNELEAYNNILANNIASDRVGTPEMGKFMDSIGMASHDQASVYSRSEGLKSHINTKNTKSLVRELANNHALGYATDIKGRYGELYNRRIAEGLGMLSNKELVQVTANRYYNQSPRAGEPLQGKYFPKRTPTVLIAELKRRKLLDIDNPAIQLNDKSKRKLRSQNDFNDIPDNAFDF
jgi:hypothetical protein